MTTKRIRCGCGRVYDPVKRPACPDCGAVNVVTEVAAAEPTPETTPVVSKAPSTGAPAPPARAPISINPRLIAIGAAVVFLLVIVMALSRCGGKDKSTAVEHDRFKVQPSASPSASVAASVASPSPSAQGPTPVIDIPPRRDEKPSPPATTVAEENDLAAMIANAAPGATIKIRAGIYRGLVVTRPVRLVGDPNMQVFIKGDGKECLSVRASDVFVQNVQFLCTGIGELPAISVAPGTSLEMEACTVQSGTAIGLLAAGNTSVKALGSTFAVPSGTGVRLTQQAKASLTQCSFPDTNTGLTAWRGATADLHSCAFERNGGSNGQGAILAVTGERTTVTADDCHFTSNHAGLLVSKGASLSITNSAFKENDSMAANGSDGLIVVRESARVTLTGDSFEANRHGVAVAAGGILEMQKCQFAGTGLPQSRQIVLSSFPISVVGQGSSATIRSTTIADSMQYGVNVAWGAKIVVEDTEISGSRNVGVVVGAENGAPAQAEIRRSRFHHNGAGIGVFAAGSAKVEESEIRDNQDGIIVVDKGTRLTATKLTVAGNRDAGLYVHGNAEVTVSDSDFQNNARGAVSGAKGKASERASLTLDNCRIGGNRVFGVGACTQSELILTRCVFDGTDKTNIYKERGANIQITDAPVPSPSPASPTDAETSPTPEGSIEPSASPSPQNSAESSPNREKNKPRRKPTPRPRPSTPKDIHRLIERFLPGGP